MYTCILDDKTKSATQFLALPVPVTSVKLTPQYNVLNVIDGLPIVYMICESSRGRPSPAITWYLDNGTQHTYLDDISITSSPHVSTNDVATSTLTLTPTIRDTNQSIYCNVSNGYSVISSTERPRLNVLSYPSRPIIQYNGTHVTEVYIIKGRNMSFECSSIGVPTPVIMWEIPPGKVINNSVLSIPIMQNGSYNCSAKSILSPSQGDKLATCNTSVLSVNILYPPEVIRCTIGERSMILSGIIKVVQYKPFEMNCTSDGYPPPTNFTWFMPEGSKSSETRLELPSVKSIGNNSYTLRVSNTMKGTFDTDVTVGYSTTTFTFDILYPPMMPDLYYNGSTHMPINTSIIHVLRGHMVSILCNTSSNPNPRYNWFVDGTQTTTAKIWNAKIQNNTRVQCYVSNTMNATGKQSVTTSSNSLMTIVTMFAPDTPTFTFHSCGTIVKTNYLKVIRGRSVNGTCTTFSNPDSIYSWIPATFGHLNSFVIRKSNSSNSGNYTCTATYKMITTFDGTIEGNTNSSLFLDILVPVDVQSIANATVELNSNYSVECRYREGNPVLCQL
ncbi:hypothetical protein DPMN_132609 [Dreissena polymorpha]|uniref:Ig-like domain-containing protein n=1 Tax=Dreissena polymorpha TaxID=45954 RepID=A0A9D4FST7_DREPO|nr:hypothetical protein DPMN_132609 [Dreissena polymorpha]